MEQKEPEKKMPSMQAKAIRRSANDLELRARACGGREGDWLDGVGQPVSPKGAASRERVFAGEWWSRQKWIAARAGRGLAGAHLSIHLIAQSAFFVTQGMFCIAWKRYVFCLASLM